ncbi:MAG: hypothetical protein M3409_10965, partial [Gemmatimonadota bacterium]|nr:hypothetical protein [Gemmatimonadota bacterium]
MHRAFRTGIPLVSLLAVAIAAPAQDAGQLSVERIFRQGDFRSAPLPSPQWLQDGRSFVDLRPDPQGGADIVRVDAATGTAQVIAPAARIVDERGQRIDVEEIQLSEDESRALLFHSSVRVWRSNTRGVFHVIDFATGRVTPVAVASTRGGVTPSQADSATVTPQLGGEQPDFLARGLASGAADPDLQMFAKFSPDGRQ